MRAFNALLVDSYRELNSRKLFWVVLALSMLIVLVYASIGFDETGMFMFFGLTHIENELLVRGSPLAGLLYRGIFTSFMVGLWLAWAATILALISTMSVFPDFMSGGSIDLVLAKPIGRLRLFLYKYFASLLFVILQVTIFCTGVFLCLVIRLDDWEWRIFWVIPVVVLFYSYLFSISVLVGVVTRSALTALLATLLLWSLLFAVNLTDSILRTQMANLDRERASHDEAITRWESRRAEGLLMPGGETALEEEKKQMAKVQDVQAKLEPWVSRSRAIKAVLPKTSETIGLLDRWLAREGDLNLLDIFQGNIMKDDSGAFRRRSNIRDEAAAEQAVLAEEDAVSWWWIIGSSLAFEAVILGAAAFVFVRRDF